MNLVRVRLRNFRCYKDEISIDIGDITAFIGKNDSGKSSILDALSIFFEENNLFVHPCCNIKSDGRASPRI